jgi:hypothetical protein
MDKGKNEGQHAGFFFALCMICGTDFGAQQKQAIINKILRRR